MTLERDYQRKLIRKIELEFPGAMVLKNDSSYKQGIPDLLVLNGRGWAMLEVKKDQRSPLGPNQNYYLDLLNDMSYASCIYPEIEEVILDELQHTFESKR